MVPVPRQRRQPRDVIHLGASVYLVSDDAYPLVPRDWVSVTRQHTENRDFVGVNIDVEAEELSPAGMVQLADLLEEAAAKVRALAGEWFA